MRSDRRAAVILVRSIILAAILYGLRAPWWAIAGICVVYHDCHGDD